VWKNTLHPPHTGDVSVEPKTGMYLGTEIDEKWWKRYLRDKLFARGNGTYRLDGEGLWFKRHLTKRPIMIRYGLIEEIKVGKSHAGRWCSGHLILKVVWNKDGRRLSSGFLVSRNEVDTLNIKSDLEARVRQA
jgi:hypothetical protein